MSKYCKPDCEHLNITEEQQQACTKNPPHICLRYNVRLYHMLAHPNIYKCEQCYMESILKRPEVE